MSYGGEGVARMRVPQVVVLIVFGVIAARLAYIQLIDSKYEELARGNALRYEVQYPSRGEVFDRNGEYLVQSRECYDLMVIYREMDREGFDTTLFCRYGSFARRACEGAGQCPCASACAPYGDELYVQGGQTSFRRV